MVLVSACLTIHSFSSGMSYFYMYTFILCVVVSCYWKINLIWFDLIWSRYTPKLGMHLTRFDQVGYCGNIRWENITLEIALFAEVEYEELSENNSYTSLYGKWVPPTMTCHLRTFVDHTWSNRACEMHSQPWGYTFNLWGGVSAVSCYTGHFGQTNLFTCSVVAGSTLVRFEQCFSHDLSRSVAGSAT